MISILNEFKYDNPIAVFGTISFFVFFLTIVAFYIDKNL